MINKKNYTLTLTNSGSFKVEAWDKYGKYVSVYTKTRQEASDFIMSWWDKSDANKRSDTLWREAMTKMVEIDKQNGFYTGNRDGLD